MDFEPYIYRDRASVLEFDLEFGAWSLGLGAWGFLNL